MIHPDYCGDSFMSMYLHVELLLVFCLLLLCFISGDFSCVFCKLCCPSISKLVKCSCYNSNIKGYCCVDSHSVEVLIVS